MSSFSDTALISRVIINDDRNAFGELMRRYQSNVRLLLLRLTKGNTALSDDLAQETFIRAYRKIASFKGQARFMTWLYRIAYNVFISSVPKHVTEEYVDGDAHAISPVKQCISDRILTRIDLNMCMKHLSVPEQTTLYLCFGKDLTHEEIAVVLKCPLGTVKTHINRAKLKMRRILEADIQEN